MDYSLTFILLLTDILSDLSFNRSNLHAVLFFLLHQCSILRHQLLRQLLQLLNELDVLILQRLTCLCLLLQLLNIRLKTIKSLLLQGQVGAKRCHLLS
jgi:hypothetical protein